MMAKQSQWLTLPEAARLIGVTDNTLRNWVDAGKVRHIRLPSGQVRIDRQVVEQILTPIEPDRCPPRRGTRP